MQEKSERAYPDTANDSFFACTIDITRPDHDVRDSKFLAVLCDNLFLFDLREAIGFSAKFAMLFDRAGFVQAPPLTLLKVGVDGERTHENKPSQARVRQTRIEQIARRNDRVHKSIRK